MGKLYDLWRLGSLGNLAGTSQEPQITQFTQLPQPAKSPYPTHLPYFTHLPHLTHFPYFTQPPQAAKLPYLTHFPYVTHFPYITQAAQAEFRRPSYRSLFLVWVHFLGRENTRFPENLLILPNSHNRYSLPSLTFAGATRNPPQLDPPAATLNQCTPRLSVVAGGGRPVRLSRGFTAHFAGITLAIHRKTSYPLRGGWAHS